MVKEGFESREQGNKLKVWGRGVDVTKFHPNKRSQAFRIKYGFAPDDVVVLWVGRCVPEKRPDVFIQVMQALTKRFPERVKGVIVGRGSSYNAMCAVKNCVGLGWQTSDNLPEIYASCDVLCFPSTVETFGNVTLEAMASGIPVVAAEVCSSHLVESGVNGYAITGIDASGYTEAIVKLIEDSKLSQSMGKAGRERAVRDFEITDVMSRMVDNYVEESSKPPFKAKSLPIVNCVGLVLLLECPYLTIYRLGRMTPRQWAAVCAFLILMAIYLYGGDEVSPEEQSYAWILGVALATGAQLSGAVAKVLFKHYYKVKPRIKKLVILATSYVCIIILNPVLGLAAYSFAAQSLLAPLSILNLVWNAVLANFVLGETLTKANMVAYVLICSGCMLSSYFGIHTHKDYSYDELMGLFSAPLFKAFMLLELVIGLVSGYITYVGEKEYPPWIVRVMYGCLAGMLGGNQFLSKSLSEVISAAIRDDYKLILSPGALFLIIGTVLVLVSGLRVLQRGLKNYTAMSLVPIYQGFFTITMVASALVFFREYELFTVKMAQAYFFSLVLIFGGISQMQPPEMDDAEEIRGEHMA
eukprot:CAMPEP_0184498820 /NCGR_PEP_ID=MMETSP0113_2-20130426/39921_1 /TAXON_ID=91329 /ORGANISM="Norrisiella sphaerica, Strain BC52" /LENGTH=582 /DNA_ID=CAMNT_0026886485 /DNA_START=552 /DNA_END=2300 /DNA_ORIENTATION=+